MDIDDIHRLISRVVSDDYETVAASQTDQALGATGGVGDYLAGLLIVPATTSPGAVSIKDGGGSAITVFAGGALSVSTGTNVSVIAIGKFT